MTKQEFRICEKQLKERVQQTVEELKTILNKVAMCCGYTEGKF